MDEMSPLSPDNQASNPGSMEGHRARRLRVLLILSLTILAADAPVVYAHLALAEGGVSKNDLLCFVILPLVSAIVMIGTVIVARKAKCGFPRIDISWLGEKVGWDILGVVALPITVLITSAILNHIFEILHMPRRQAVIFSTTAHPTALLIVQTLRMVYITPVVEEVFWRGYVQDVLQRTLNRPLAVFGQAVLFASGHMTSLAGRASIFFNGLIVGTWRCKKRSLVPLIVTHMVVNSLSCAGLWLDYLKLRMAGLMPDYRVTLEKLCTPAGHASNENALSHYTRAFEALVERPKELTEADLKAWPADLPAEKMHLLHGWISSNRDAIGEFEEGSAKPYYCPQYSRIVDVAHIMFPPRSKAKLMASVVLSRAQMRAIEGDLRQSFSDVLACVRFGRHFTGPKSFVEQVTGLQIEEQATQVAFRVLKRIEANHLRLKELQVGLEAVSKKRTAPIDFSGEKLICHEFIRLALSEYGRSPILQTGRPVSQASRDRVRRQMTRLEDDVFAYLDSIKGRTPAELHRAGTDVPDTVRKMVRDAKEQMAIDDVVLLTLLYLMESYGGAYYGSYRFRACTEALIVTVAIKRYELEQGCLPDELNQLVRSGYLDSLPLDPYSDAPFVYRKLNSDFLLYSLGPDCEDDGGISSTANAGVAGADDVFWPPEDNWLSDHRQATQ